MIKREYYSTRTGKMIPSQLIDLETLKEMFLVIYKKLRADRYFVEYFGEYWDNYDFPGKLGNDISGQMFLKLKKKNLYPIEKNLATYSEDNLFDVIEFLYDHCSKVNYGNNNNNYYDDTEGKKHFRNSFNEILGEYKNGFEISEKGEILNLADNGLSILLEANTPINDENTKNKIEHAILKFRKSKSTLEDRKEAIRELADVLEFLKPEITKRLNHKDEKDLFNIANNFGIRHHNKDQQTNYDKPIWYSWIFYFFLATIHAILRLKDKK